MLPQPLTTDDICALHDDDPLQYALRFSAMMVGGLAFGAVLNGFVGSLDSGIYWVAGMAAWIGTQPTNKPRFRSVKRHLGTFAILVVFGLASPLFCLLIPEADLSVKGVLLTVSAISMMAALIDTVRYVSLCAVTPGPATNSSATSSKPADHHCIASEDV